MELIEQSDRAQIRVGLGNQRENEIIERRALKLECREKISIRITKADRTDHIIHVGVDFQPTGDIHYRGIISKDGDKILLKLLSGFQSYGRRGADHISGGPVESDCHLGCAGIGVDHIQGSRESSRRRELG